MEIKVYLKGLEIYEVNFKFLEFYKKIGYIFYEI